MIFPSISHSMRKGDLLNVCSKGVTKGCEEVEVKGGIDP